MLFILDILSTITLMFFTYVCLTQWSNKNCVQYDGQPVSSTTRKVLISIWMVSWWYAIYAIWM